MWRFLISKSDDNKYSLEKLIVFQKLFLLIDYDSLRGDYWWYFIEKDEKEFLSKLEDIFKEVFEKIDKILKDYEMQIFTFTSSKSLDIFSSTFRIKEFARIFCDEVKKQKIEKYALKDLNCYASMEIDKKIYITVNEIEKGID